MGLKFDLVKGIVKTAAEVAGKATSAGAKTAGKAAVKGAATSAKVAGKAVGGVAADVGKGAAHAVKVTPGGIKQMDKFSRVGMGAAVFGGAAFGIASGASGTLRDYANESGMSSDAMSDYAVRQAFSGSKGQRELQQSTMGLTNSLSSGKSTSNRSIRKKF